MVIKKKSNNITNICKNEHFILKQIFTLFSFSGLEYEPRCSNKVNENLRTTCRLFCPHKTIITFLAPSKNSVNLFCEKNVTYLNTCSHSKEGLETFVTSINNEPGDVDCVVSKKKTKINIFALSFRLE